MRLSVRAAWARSIAPAIPDVVPVKPSAGAFEFEAPKALFTLPAFTRSDVFGPAVSRYAVTADGSRFLALTDRGTAPPRRLTVVTNWERAFEGRK
jgi:hypothetical protein